MVTSLSRQPQVPWQNTVPGWVPTGSMGYRWKATWWHMGSRMLHHHAWSRGRGTSKRFPNLKWAHSQVSLLSLQIWHLPTAYPRQDSKKSNFPVQFPLSGFSSPANCSVAFLSSTLPIFQSVRDSFLYLKRGIVLEMVSGRFSNFPQKIKHLCLYFLL